MEEPVELKVATRGQFNWADSPVEGERSKRWSLPGNKIVYAKDIPEAMTKAGATCTALEVTYAGEWDPKLGTVINDPLPPVVWEGDVHARKQKK